MRRGLVFGLVFFSSLTLSWSATAALLFPGARIAVTRAQESPDGVEPLVLATADTDGDRVEEVVAGCATRTGGALLAFPAEPGRTVVDPFVLGKPFIIADLPFEPDLLAARCDAAFSPCELWAAERGGAIVAAIRRDPLTQRWEVDTLELPGAVTALTTGELGVPDGLAEVAIGLDRREGGAVALVPGIPSHGDGASEYRTPEPVIVPWQGTPEDVALTRAVRPGRGTLAAVAEGRCFLLQFDELGGALDRTALPRSWPVPLPGIVTSLLAEPLTVRERAGLAVSGPDGLWLIGPGEGGEGLDARKIRAQVETPRAAVRWGGGGWALVTGAGTVLPLRAPGGAKTEAQAWALPLRGAGRPGAIRAAARLRRSGRALAPVALILGDGAVALATPLPRATFTVDSNADTGDANPGDGTCDDGTGHCTLRAAIEEANAHSGADAIVFSSDFSISPATPLPDITEAVSIDGSYNLIRIFCQSLPAGSNGLVVHADDVTIRNLDVWNVPAGSASSEGNGILLQGTPADRIDNAVISGIWAHSCGGSGIRLDSTRSCHIGPFVSLSANGIGLSQAFWGWSNVFEGIYSDSNDGAGLELLVGYDTVVGTCAGGDAVFLRQNAEGLVFNSFATGTVVCGSSMASDPSLGNGVGVYIGSNASGGIALTDVTVSGNTGDGIKIVRADGSTNWIVIQHSWIGTNAGGATDVGNGGWGIRLEKSTGLRLRANSVVEYNGQGGILVSGTSSDPAEDILIGGFGSDGGARIRSNQGPGLQLTEYSRNVTIENVEIASNTGPGVLVSGGSDENRASVAYSTFENNGDGGVVVDGAKGVSITGDTFLGEAVGVGLTGDADAFIFRSTFESCGQQCIDLGLDGVTNNDAGDCDMGPNDFLNFPEIGLARSCGGQTMIPMGWLDLDQGGGYVDVTLQFWVSDGCDGTGHGPAEQYLGEERVSSPYGFFSASFLGEYAGKTLTSTANVQKWFSGYLVGMTSELSSCVTIQPTYGGDADDDCSWDARDLALIIGALHGETLPPGGNADCTDSGGTDKEDLPCTAHEIFSPHML